MLVAAINTAIAAVSWIEDPRPWWHPLVSSQCFGFAIAWCVNVVRPWESDAPLRRLVASVAAGSIFGLLLVIVVKQYSLDHITHNLDQFVRTLLAAFGNGLLISLIFLIRYRETRATAALGRAEAERYRLQKQAVEAELKLLQAQVEPHFLFNTLASVQYLAETDPPAANRMLGHLIAYLRAALPHLRASSSTVGKEFDLAREYLSILKMRMGERLAFSAAVPEALRDHPFPPNMLNSLVENAVRHGVEPAAAGGTIELTAQRIGGQVEVIVTDTGIGLNAQPATIGSGVGVANLRERLAALFGERGRFALEPMAPKGTRALISVPFQSGA